MEEQKLTNAVIIEGAFTDNRISDCAGKSVLAVPNKDGDGIVLTSYPDNRQIVIVLSDITLEALSELIETGKIL